MTCRPAIVHDLPDRFRPAFKGVWSAAVNLLHCHSLIPGRINAYGLTNHQMVVLDTMHLEAGRIVHGELHEHHRGKERKHHCTRGVVVGPLLPGTCRS
jgi:hypothetical protein